MLKSGNSHEKLYFFEKFKIWWNGKCEELTKCKQWSNEMKVSGQNKITTTAYI